MPTIIENDDIPGIQRLIHKLSAAEGISIFELADRSGLHPTTLYAILKKKSSATRRPVRRETIGALAEGNRYTVTFDAVKKRVILEKSVEPEPKNDVDDLLDGMRRVLARSGRKKFTAQERGKILEVVRVLVS
jgi:transcriptional regulator with XRE-family HTH domain